MTHISAIPLELIMYIFKWVVSTELDMKSLEHLGRVQRNSLIYILLIMNEWGLYFLLKKKPSVDTSLYNQILNENKINKWNEQIK